MRTRVSARKRLAEMNLSPAASAAIEIRFGVETEGDPKRRRRCALPAHSKLRRVRIDIYFRAACG